MHVDLLDPVNYGAVLQVILWLAIIEHWLIERVA
jgi:hypothetical protein